LQNARNERKKVGLGNEEERELASQWKDKKVARMIRAGVIG